MFTFIELSMLGSIVQYSTLLEHPEYMYSQMFWLLAKSAKFNWNGSSFSFGIKHDTSIIVNIMRGEMLSYKRFYKNSIDLIKIL